MALPITCLTNISKEKKNSVCHDIEIHHILDKSLDIFVSHVYKLFCSCASALALICSDMMDFGRKRVARCFC